jgi:tetratricopeptide (TPR) repeat protein
VRPAPFVGRETQLAALRSALQAAQFGERVLALVAGEPGIGKTRLVDEVTHEVGSPVLWSACWAGEGAPPYWPWVQLLRQMTGSQMTGSAGAEPDLRRLVGQEQSADVSPAARFRLFDAVADAVATACRERPHVLVVDDLHWADEGSLRLLQFLSQDPRIRGLAILGTYRDSDLDEASALARCLADLVRDGLHLALGGLSGHEVAGLLAALLGERADPADVPLLHRLSGGNPFFLRELAYLLESEVPPTRSGDEVHLAVPAGVRAVASRRLDRLFPATRETLRVAAVLGFEPDLLLLAAVTGLPVVELLAAVEEASAAGLVVPASGRDGGFTFAHAIVRDVLYQELGADRRAALHGEAAAAVEDRYGDARRREVARHLLRTTGVPASRLVDVATRAAEQSLELLAYEEAVGWYSRALGALRAELPGGVREGELLLACGEARLAAGDLPGARESFTAASDVARRLGHPEMLARAALGLGSGLGGFEVQLFDPVQVELLERALDAVDPEPSTLRARLLARLSVASSFLDDESRRSVLAEAAVAMARQVGDPTALGYALAAHCDVIAGPDSCEARLAEATEVAALGQRTADRQLELLGRRLRVVALLEIGDVGEADREVDRFARVADALRQPLYHWYVPLWRGMRALMRGDLGEAARQCAAAEDEGLRAHSGNAAVLVFTQWWVRQRYEGRFHKAGTAMAEALSQLLAGPLVTAGPRAVAAAQVGDLDAARTHLRQWRVAALHERPGDSEWLPESAQLAQAAVAVGDRDVAEILYEQLAPFAHRCCVEGIGAAFTGSTAWYLAALARFLGHRDEAEAYEAQARTAHGRVGLVGEPPPMVAPATSGPADPAAAAPATGSASMVREGATWAVTFAGRTGRLRDSKGLADLAVLVVRPDREVHCLELMGAVDVASDAGPVLDQRARRAYERRIRDLQEDIDEAGAAGDPVRAERAEVELDALVQQLAEAFGLSGRSRVAGSTSERARSAVSWRIRAALRAAADVHPELARHLRNSVRTGTWCAYRPESPVQWTVDLGDGARGRSAQGLRA